MVQKELIDAFELAIPLANLAGQAISDNMFDAVISEGEFQKRVRSFLRSHPNIGSALEEHPRAAGGITDLSLHGIRLELKSEKEKHLAFADCEQFVEQTASYAVGSGKKLAVLCVLDCSAKTKTAFPIEDGIGFFVHRRTETLIHVLTILISGQPRQTERIFPQKTLSRMTRHKPCESHEDCSTFECCPSTNRTGPRFGAVLAICPVANVQHGVQHAICSIE